MSATISVLGGANFDISAALTTPFVANDSNPGSITLGYGGVGRNIAHNLCLLGHHVMFITAFGGDIFGGLMQDQCKNIGLDLSLSLNAKSERTGLYLCINNHAGEMIAAVADTNVVNNITPAYIEKITATLNKSDLIVADTNLAEDTLLTILNNAGVPVFIDGVSTAKTRRIVNVMKQTAANLYTLKLNQKEAFVVTETDNCADAAQKLLQLNIENVYITLGNGGVYCRNREQETTFPALPAEVVNTTGAGDAFLAGVVHAFTQKIDFPQTAQYGLMTARATLLCEQAVNPDIANLLL